MGEMCSWATLGMPQRPGIKSNVSNPVFSMHDTDIISSNSLRETFDRGFWLLSGDMATIEVEMREFSMFKEG